MRLIMASDLKSRDRRWVTYSNTGTYVSIQPQSEIKNTAAHCGNFVKNKITNEIKIRIKS